MDTVGEQRRQFRRVINPSQIRQHNDLMMTESIPSRLVQEHQDQSKSSGWSASRQWYPTGRVDSIYYHCCEPISLQISIHRWFIDDRNFFSSVWNLNGQSQGEVRAPFLVQGWCLLTVPSHGKLGKAVAPSYHLATSLRLYFLIASHQKVKFQHMNNVRVITILHTSEFLSYLRLPCKEHGRKGIDNVLGFVPLL